MTNPIELFNNQASDGTSTPFKAAFADSKGFQDNPTYIEFFGTLGGGTIDLQKLGGDGVSWFSLTKASIEINANFPDIFALDSLNSGTYRVVLSGSTSPQFSCYVYNAR